MHKKYFVIILCAENSQELADFIDALNFLSNVVQIKVNIVSLELLYHDLLFNKMLRDRALFDYEVLRVAPVFKSECPFPYLDAKKKVLTVLKRKGQIVRFAKTGDLVLVGIQAVFQRLLYSQLKDRPFVAFHRAILFDHQGRTNRSQGLLCRGLSPLLKLMRLDYLIGPKSGVGYASHYLVVGDLNREYLESNDISPGRIVVVGSPTYDVVGRYCSSGEQASGNKPLRFYFITSAFEWIGDEEGECWQKKKIREFINLARNNNDISLTIRVHPRETADKYELLKKKFPFIKIDHYSSTDLFADLAKYDVICGGFSTVLFEAMLINKPVIYYLTQEEQARYQYGIEQTKLQYFTNIKEVNAMIQNRFLGGDKESMKQLLENQQQIVSRVIYSDSKENAAERIAVVLLDIIKNKKHLSRRRS